MTCIIKYRIESNKTFIETENLQYFNIKNIKCIFNHKKIKIILVTCHIRVKSLFGKILSIKLKVCNDFETK